MKSLMEYLFEATRPTNSYPKEFAAFNQILSDVDDCIWVFYDTESTGLKPEMDFVQVTQVAAIAFNPNGFVSEPDLVPNGQFNERIMLNDAALQRMADEPDLYWHHGEETRGPLKGQVTSRPSSKKTLRQLLQMNDYDGWVTDGKIPKPMLQVGLEFTEYLERMRQASPSGEIIIIAHNNRFDDAITTEMYRRIEQPLPYEEMWDSLQIANSYFKSVITQISKQQNNKPRHQKIIDALRKEGKTGKTYISSAMANLTAAFDISSEGHHNALADVKMSMNVLYAVIKWLRAYYSL